MELTPRIVNSVDGAVRAIIDSLTGTAKVDAAKSSAERAEIYMLKYLDSASDCFLVMECLGCLRECRLNCLSFSSADRLLVGKHSNSTGCNKGNRTTMSHSRTLLWIFLEISISPFPFTFIIGFKGALEHCQRKDQVCLCSLTESMIVIASLSRFGSFQF